MDLLHIIRIIGIVACIVVLVFVGVTIAEDINKFKEYKRAREKENEQLIEEELNESVKRISHKLYYNKKGE